MKADLTDYNHQRKFNALYWGQPVGITWVETGSVETKPCQAQVAFMLCLKSLSSISDEDCLVLAENALGDNKDQTDLINHAKNIIIGLSGSTGFESSKVDYLRSKGYALPWMGLTVEEMVEAGWIKLV